MPQDPFKVDQLQVQPDSALPILVKAIGGDLAFQDGTVTGGLKFKDLAGFSLSNLLTVGVGGTGAQYTTIQSAIDAIPASASATNPYVVFIGPGVYQETVNIVRDGVFIYGNGATLQSEAEATPNGAGAYHTVVIQAGLGTIPRNVAIHGVAITNAHDAYSCVRVTGGAASDVGSGAVRLVDCNLQAVAPGGNRPIWADSVNNVVMQGGSMTGSSAISLVFAQETARFVLDGVRDVPAFQLDYDSGGTLPSAVGSAYEVNNCLNLGASSTLSPPLNSTLSGAGSLTIAGCTGGADLAVSGDRTVDVLSSSVGDVTLGGTTAARFVGSSRGTAVGATASLAEPHLNGTVTLPAAPTAAVTFDPPQPDTSYHVSLTVVGGAPVGEETPRLVAKGLSGFSVGFTSAQSVTVEWSVSRRM